MPAVPHALVIYTYVSVSTLDAPITDGIQRRCHLLVTCLLRVC